MTFKHWASALAIALLAASPAAGQSTITGNDVEEILRIARMHGKARLVEQKNGNPQITGRMNGLLYQIFFLNCTDGADCEDINFYLGFLDIEPTLEVINDWNYNKRFSRAYIDRDNDACVEMDLDLAVPVSVEYMESTFDLWSLIVTQFAEHVGYTG